MFSYLISVLIPVVFTKTIFYHLFGRLARLIYAMICRYGIEYYISILSVLCLRLVVTHVGSQ